LTRLDPEGSIRADDQTRIDCSSNRFLRQK
jgi:hypothetical protein